MSNQCIFHKDPIAGYSIEQVDSIRPICARCIPNLSKGYHGELKFLSLDQAQDLLQRLKSTGLQQYKEEVMSELQQQIEQAMKILEQLLQQMATVLDLIIKSDTLQEQLLTKDHQQIADILYNNCQYSEIEQKYKIKTTNVVYSQINFIVKQCKMAIQSFKERINDQLQLLTNQEMKQVSSLNESIIDVGCRELFKLDVLKSRYTDMVYYQKYSWLLSASDKIYIWDIKTKKVISTLSEHTGQVKNMLLNNDILITCGYDCRLLFWQFDKQWIVKQSLIINSLIVQMTKYQNSIASIHEDKTLRLWDNGKCIKTLSNKTELTSIDCNADFTQIAIGQVDGIVRVRKAEYNLKLEGHTDCVKSIKFLQQTLITGGWDKQIKIWMELQNGDYKLLQTLYDHSTYINFIVPIGDVIVSIDDKVIKIWEKKKVWQQITQIGRYPQVLSVTSFNQVLFLGLNDQTIQVLQIK